MCTFQIQIHGWLTSNHRDERSTNQAEDALRVIKQPAQSKPTFFLTQNIGTVKNNRLNFLPQNISLKSQKAHNPPSQHYPNHSPSTQQIHTTFPLTATLPLALCDQKCQPSGGSPLLGDCNGALKALYERNSGTGNPDCSNDNDFGSACTCLPKQPLSLLRNKDEACQ